MFEKMEFLANQRRRLQFLCIACVLLYLAVFVCTFFSKPVAFAIFAVNVLFHVFYIRRRTAKYQLQVAEQVVSAGMAELLTEVHYCGKDAISRETLKAMPLLPGDEKERTDALLREGFIGQSKKTAVRGSEFTLHYLSPKEGKSRKPHFWSGTLLELTTETASPFRFLLVSRRLIRNAAEDYLAGYQVLEVEIPDESLADRFALFTFDGENTALPEPVIQHMKKLSEAIPEDFGVCIRDDRILVYLNGLFYVPKIVLKQQIKPELFQVQRLPELKQILLFSTFCAKFKEK